MLGKKLQAVFFFFISEFGVNKLVIRRKNIQCFFKGKELWLVSFSEWVCLWEHHHGNARLCVCLHRFISIFFCCFTVVVMPYESSQHARLIALVRRCPVTAKAVVSTGPFEIRLPSLLLTSMWVKLSSQQSWRNQRECVLLTHNSTRSIHSAEPTGMRHAGSEEEHEAGATETHTWHAGGQLNVLYEIMTGWTETSETEKKGGKKEAKGWGRGKWATWRVPEEMLCGV